MSHISKKHIDVTHFKKYIYIVFKITFTKHISRSHLLILHFIEHIYKITFIFCLKLHSKNTIHSHIY